MYRLEDYLYPKSKFIMVLHTRPDLDCMVAVFIFMMAVGLSLFQVLTGERIIFRYVKSGSIYTPTEKEVLEGWMVVHADIGARYDPAYGYFDHHFKPVIYWSAARAIFDYFFTKTGREAPTYIYNLVDYTDYVDSGSKVGKTPGWIYNELDVANEMLKAVIGWTGHFRPFRKGPDYFGKLVKYIPLKSDDTTRLIMGLTSLESYVLESKTETSSFDALVEAKQLVGLTKRQKSLVSVKTNRTMKGLPALGRKILVVLPIQLVTMDVVAVKLLQHIRSERTDSIEYAFVQKEEMYTGYVSNGVTVIHLGVGGVYDEAKLLIDTSADNSPYNNETEAIFDIMYHDDSRTPVFIRSFVKFVNMYYSGITDLTLTSEEYVELENYHDMIKESVGVDVMFVSNHRAPTCLVQVIDNLPWELGPEGILEIGMLFMEGFFESTFQKPLIRNYVEMGEKVVHNRLVFVKLPKSGYTSKDLRGIIRDYYRDIDSYVTECDYEEVDKNDPDAELDRRFAITISRDADDVKGMQVLKERIYQADSSLHRKNGKKEGDVFLFPGGEFVIYINARTSLTLDEVWELALDTLSMKEEVLVA